MEKSQRKILLAIIIILILIIILIISFLIYLNLNNENLISNDQIAENEIINEVYEVEEIEANTEIRLVDSQSQYYSVVACINNYYKAILDGNNKKLYDTLDNRYIQENSITQENVIEKINTSNFSNSDYIVKNMYIQETENIYNYYINGYLREQGMNTNTYFVLFVDQYNSTYSIYPINEERYNNIIELKESIESNTISENDNNLYQVVQVSDEDTAKRLLEDYQYKIENNIQLAYEELDSEYRQKKFSDIEEYTQYINNIGISQSNVVQYQKSKIDDYVQYIILDENGRYYVFNETSVMKYNVLLDIYTIELPNFVESYSNSNEAEKVQYNIQLWFYTINDGDYAYAYNKLDQTYRNNNFPTQVDFENYMKTTFYAYNKLGYTSYEKNGDLYIYKMVITNSEDSTQTIEKQFVVKLLEGTDFVMSFEK